MSLNSFCDVNWVGILLKGGQLQAKSLFLVTIIYLGSVKKQPMVGQSTTEVRVSIASYLATTTAELSWIRQIPILLVPTHLGVAMFQPHHLQIIICFMRGLNT